MRKNLKETLSHINEAAERKATDFIKKTDEFEEKQKEKKKQRKQRCKDIYEKLFHTHSCPFGTTEKEVQKICVWFIAISYPLIFTIPHLHPQISQELLSGALLIEDILFSITKAAMILLTYFLVQKIEITKLSYLLLPCIITEIAYDLFIFAKFEMMHQSPAIAFLICAVMIIGLKGMEGKIKKKSLRYLAMCAYVNLCWYFIIGTNPEHGVLIFFTSILFYLFRNYMTAGLLLLILIAGVLMQGLLCCILAAAIIFFKDNKSPEKLGKSETILLMWAYPIIFTISATLEKIFL